MVLTLKVWAVFFAFVVLGQLRPGQGGTLEQRFHDYLNQDRPQKFFVGLLSPVHGFMSLVGIEVDEASIQAVRESPEELKKLKKSLKENEPSP